MRWQKIVARSLSLAVVAALLVWEVLGVTPGWWAPALAGVTAIANIVLGSWRAPV